MGVLMFDCDVNSWHELSSLSNNKASVIGSVMLLLTPCDPEQNKEFIIIWADFVTRRGRQ